MSSVAFEDDNVALAVLEALLDLELVPRSAVEQDLLDQREFAGVFGTTFLESLDGRDLSAYGETAYADGDPGGVPTTPLA